MLVLSGQKLDEKQQLSFDETFFDAMSFRLKGNYTKSNEFLFSCLQINPQSDVSLFKLGQNYMDLKKYDEAEKYIAKAIKKNKNNKWYRESFIRLQILKGEKETNILKQIERFKNQANNKYLIASLYRELYQKKKASKKIAPSISRNQNNSYIDELKSLIDQKEYDKMIQSGEKYLEKNPDNSLIYFLMGQAYHGLKNNTDALDYLDMGMDFVLNDKKLLKKYYLLYAQIYKQIGNMKKYNYYKSKFETL